MISTWIRALLLESLTLLLLCFRALPTAAQPGFISIDCGSASQKNYTSNSGIKWSNDDNYILGGYDSGPVWTWQGDWAEQLHSFRYFNESRSKFCYGLPVEVNKTYLVRAGFLWGNFSDLSEGPISFDLTVFSSLWKTVEVSAVTDFRSDLKDGVTSPLTAETIVRSTSSVMNVCLVRKTGNPFINSLELRPMDDDMYVDVFKNKLLVNHWRWTAGRCCLSSPR
ncbi:hypothetical protein Mapa_001741 [Marchantia paleacea]|nr:hypothetical protein Mapa_001741 [Marchantia paleacea]